MFKGIKDILKTMGEALKYADAGEMLSQEHKAKVLAQYKGSCSIAPDMPPPRVVLAADGEAFPNEAVERTIALCLENKALLDLLCVTPQGSNTSIHLATVLPRLESETDLDFQITRRNGDLLAVIDAYLHMRQDILLILIHVSDHMREQVRTKEWLQTVQIPGVKIIENVILA